MSENDDITQTEEFQAALTEAKEGLGPALVIGLQLLVSSSEGQGRPLLLS